MFFRPVEASCHQPKAEGINQGSKPTWLSNMECQKQKNKKIYPYLLFMVIHFLYCISINIFKFLVDYLHAIHIFILHYMIIHFLYCISINTSFLLTIYMPYTYLYYVYYIFSLHTMLFALHLHFCITCRFCCICYWFISSTEQ